MSTPSQQTTTPSGASKRDVAQAAANALSQAALSTAVASKAPQPTEADVDLFGDDLFGADDAGWEPESTKAAAPPTDDIEAQWLVRTADDAIVGPVSLDLIQRGLNVGRVPEDAEIAPEGSDDWRAVRSVLPAEEDAPAVEPPVDRPSQAVVARSVIAVGDSKPATAEQEPAAATRTPQTWLPKPSAALASAAAVASSAVVTSMPPKRPQPPQAAAAKVSLRLPPSAHEPAWSKAATAVMPRVALGATSLSLEPVVIPKHSMLPALIAFGATVVLSGLAALAFFLLR